MTLSDRPNLSGDHLFALKMESLAARSAVSSLVAFAIAFRAYKKKSLDLSGAPSPASWSWPLITTPVSGWFGAMILVFFVTSSMLTKVGEEQKRKIEEEFRKVGRGIGCKFWLMLELLPFWL